MIGRSAVNGARAKRRADAKKRWAAGRAFRTLAHYYRCVDRLKGIPPRGGSWSEPLVFTDRYFQPGSPSFDRAFNMYRGLGVRTALARMMKRVRNRLP